jgi:Fe-S-cluster formation regulator IscX/YfhJ
LKSVHGTIGQWAIEVAETYPSAQVFGIDLAPNQPEVIPSNCRFVIADAIVELPEFHDCSADLINSRYKLARGVQLSSQY